ncbi:glycosyl hydrolase family protein [Dankookia rubra]|uniref:Glycosyl hydrolase family protein n=1 Tax=Dankookia rubra TaxID=1442381 RepID=A0A4R5QLE6_9PROT|nr:family 16 glycosylhydrolase [Dankookia rubra]TDH63601.1 glycosyl hydrolase family protein [Dankookia rubra]
MAILNAVSVALNTSAAPRKWLTAAKGTTLNGTSGADALSAPNGQATLSGGGGDDTYVIWDASSRIIELANGGIDTVQSYASAFALPDFVENLQLMWTGSAGRGNALHNIITAGDGSQTLDGGAGNDVLTGGTGANTFIARRGNGSDVITDFQAGIDKILLQDAALYSFGAVQAALTQLGTDTVLSLGGGERLVLRNVKASLLSAQDFMLPADPTHAGMRVTFAEEFNSLSASATGIGTTWKTTFKINDQLRTLSTNKEAEYYSDASVGVNPFSISQGILDITAAPGSNPLGLAYTSGLLTTARSFAQQYGYFEVRAQLPAGQGFWPAFWLLPADGGWPPEIDIFEMLGKDPTTAYFSLHTTTGPTTTKSMSLLPDLSKGFHTFGLDWQADRIRWYVDGNEVAEAATPADMQKPMYMLLNLAVGDAGSWPGKYDPSLPTGHMLVDYVRVWQAGTIAPPPSVTTVTGPGDVTAAGGTYTLRPDGLSDLYDFTKARAAIHLDAATMSAKPVHTVWGSALGDEVRAGAGTLNFSAGAGDDTFFFGRGTSRVQGGGGNDTFVLTKGAIAAGDQIIDFHRSLPGGGEHDLLRLDGFSSAAHLDYRAGTKMQSYVVVDGTYVSPVITIQIANAAGTLTQADYLFNRG